MTSSLTNMSVLLIVGPKCRLAASHAAPWWVKWFRLRYFASIFKQHPGADPVCLKFSSHLPQERGWTHPWPYCRNIESYVPRSAISCLAV